MERNISDMTTGAIAHEILAINQAISLIGTASVKEEVLTRLAALNRAVSKPRFGEAEVEILAKLVLHMDCAKDGPAWCVENEISYEVWESLKTKLFL